MPIHDNPFLLTLGSGVGKVVSMQLTSAFICLQTQRMLELIRDVQKRSLSIHRDFSSWVEVWLFRTNGASTGQQVSYIGLAVNLNSPTLSSTRSSKKRQTDTGERGFRKTLM